jgi:hypothetical protein
VTGRQMVSLGKNVAFDGSTIKSGDEVIITCTYCFLVRLQIGFQKPKSNSRYNTFIVNQTISTHFKSSTLPCHCYFKLFHYF